MILIVKIVLFRGISALGGELDSEAGDEKRHFLVKKCVFLEILLHTGLQHELTRAYDFFSMYNLHFWTFQEFLKRF